MSERQENHRFVFTSAGIFNSGPHWGRERRSAMPSSSRSAREFGAGDEARTRNFQLGKLDFRSFIFNTYKIAHEEYACMRCMPCMHCLSCVSLRDVCGMVFS